MRLTHLATSVLWVVPVAIQGTIALVIPLRGLARRIPVFFSYTLLLPTRDLVLMFLPYSGSRYSLVYWWGEAVAIVLTIGVIVETIWHLIAPYPFLRVVLRMFWIVAVIAAASALTMLLWTNGPSGADLALEWIILTERSARFLQVCLLIAVVFLISRLGLDWHDYSVGIAAGFGIYAALDLSLLELRAHFHVLEDPAFALLRSATYNLAVVVWAFYFFRPRQGKRVERLPSTDLANWNDALTEHIDKWYRR